MSYQLDKVLIESKLGSEKVIEIYTLLESHFRGSIMASEFNNRYPDLALDLEKSDYVIDRPTESIHSFTIVKPGHPLEGLHYSTLSESIYVAVEPEDFSKATYHTRFGWIDDRHELVLKYVRKELF